MRLQSLVLLTLLSCAAPAALAQSAPATDASQTTAAAPAQERQPLDANHDGVITRDEAQSHPGVAKHFDQIDTNHDGKIDRDEFRAFHEKMQSRRAQKQQQSTAPAADSSSG